MNQRRNTSSGRRDRKPAEPRICGVTGDTLRPRSEVVRIAGLNGHETIAGAAVVFDFLLSINPNFRLGRDARKIQVAPGVCLVRRKRGDLVLDAAQLVHEAPDEIFAKFRTFIAPNVVLLRQAMSCRAAASHQ
jgi:hypothetical protein